MPAIIQTNTPQATIVQQAPVAPQTQAPKQLAPPKPPATQTPGNRSFILPG